MAAAAAEGGGVSAASYPGSFDNRTPQVAAAAGGVSAASYLQPVPRIHTPAQPQQLYYQQTPAYYSTNSGNSSAPFPMAAAGQHIAMPQQSAGFAASHTHTGWAPQQLQQHGFAAAATTGYNASVGAAPGSIAAYYPAAPAPAAATGMQLPQQTFQAAPTSAPAAAFGQVYSQGVHQAVQPRPYPAGLPAWRPAGAAEEAEESLDDLLALLGV